MSFQVEKVNPLADPDWNGSLGAFANAGVFHGREWVEALCSTYHYEPLAFLAREGSRLRGVLVMAEIQSRLTGRRGVALPFTDHVPLLAVDSSVASALVAAAQAYGQEQRWKSLEIRDDLNAVSHAEPSATFLGHTLDLGRNEQKLLSATNASTRRSIRKAEKIGVRVRFSDQAEAVEAFRKLNERTRRDHGLPPQPKAFFHHFYRRLMAAGQAVVALAEHDGRPVAGAVFLRWGKQAYYKYGASVRAGRLCCGNHAVMWEAIRFFGSQEMNTLCFGRTEMQNKGLRQFKQGWGTSEHRVAYYRYDFSRGRYVKAAPTIYGFHNAIFRHMPLPALRLTGRLLYRHMG